MVNLNVLPSQRASSRIVQYRRKLTVDQEAGGSSPPNCTSPVCKLICDGCVADGLGSLRPPWLRSYRLHGAEKIPALGGWEEVLRTKPVGVRASRPADQHQADRCAKIEIEVEEGCKTLRHLTLAWLPGRGGKRYAKGP